MVPKNLRLVFSIHHKQETRSWNLRSELGICKKLKSTGEEIRGPFVGSGEDKEMILA